MFDCIVFNIMPFHMPILPFYQQFQGFSSQATGFFPPHNYLRNNNQRWRGFESCLHDNQWLVVLGLTPLQQLRSYHGGWWRKCVSWLSHTSTNTNFFPKPPTTFLTCFSKGERQKYAGKKFRLNRVSDSQLKSSKRKYPNTVVEPVTP